MKHRAVCVWGEAWKPVEIVLRGAEIWDGWIGEWDDSADIDITLELSEARALIEQLQNACDRAEQLEAGLEKSSLEP